MRNPYRTAVDFHNAYMTIDVHDSAISLSARDDDDEFEKLATGQKQTSMVAQVVCLAFALELYLKSLLYEKGRTSNRGHALYDLFLLLEEEMKAEIVSCFDEFPHRHGNTFYKELGLMSKAFCRWRYLHEEEFGVYFPTGFGAALAKILKEKAQEKYYSE
jgi:hypothetical protein